MAQICGVAFTMLPSAKEDWNKEYPVKNLHKSNASQVSRDMFKPRMRTEAEAWRNECT